MNNLSPYCGLVDAKIRASDKDLPVVTAYSSSNLIFRNPLYVLTFHVHKDLVDFLKNCR